MKKTICLIFTLCWIVQISIAQTAPLEIYSAYRFYKSDKTPTGTGFKLRHFTKVKHEYLFSIYRDHVAYTNKKTIIYKIYKVKRYADTSHYLTTDSSGRYFDIVVSNYAVTLMQTDKDGKWISITRFDVNKRK
jgi:hypothetical protein